VPLRSRERDRSSNSRATPTSKSDDASAAQEGGDAVRPPQAYPQARPAAAPRTNRRAGDDRLGSKSTSLRLSISVRSAPTSRRRSGHPHFVAMGLTGREQMQQTICANYSSALATAKSSAASTRGRKARRCGRACFFLALFASALGPRYLPTTRLTTMAAMPASTALAIGDDRMSVIGLDPDACC
jgi:hypothetical protein